MMKLKSGSTGFDGTINEEVKEHLSKVIEKQEELMREKLERQQQKESRVGALQKDFVEWADRKGSLIRQKIQKSAQNKEEHLTKIVKKCKDHDKFLSQKFKNFQSKRKAEVKDAWKKAEQFNHSIEDYYISRQLTHERSTHAPKTEENLAESKYYSKRPTSYEKKDPQYLTAINNNSKFHSKVYNNTSKDYWGELNQSIKHLKYTEIIPQEDNTEDHINKIQMGNKLKQTLARFKQQIEEHEQSKIQELGQRLQKIEKTRIKRIEMHKKKKQSPEADYETETPQKTYKNKVKPDRSQRIHSEATMKERRVHDWSEATRHRREQLEQAKLKSGTEYLQHQKIKYMKTTLAKKIALSAIEKKLYFERLNH